MTQKATTAPTTRSAATPPAMTASIVLLRPGTSPSALVESLSAADSADSPSIDDEEEEDGEEEGRVELDPAAVEEAEELAPVDASVSAPLFSAMALEMSIERADVAAARPVGTVVGAEAVGPPADLPLSPEASALHTSRRQLHQGRERDGEGRTHLAVPF